MPIDEIYFVVSCSATVTDKFKLQLTKTGDKARNWMTMCQNLSTEDEIDTNLLSNNTVKAYIQTQV